MGLLMKAFFWSENHPDMIGGPGEGQFGTQKGHRDAVAVVDDLGGAVGLVQGGYVMVVPRLEQHEPG